MKNNRRSARQVARETGRSRREVERELGEQARQSRRRSAQVLLLFAAGLLVAFFCLRWHPASSEADRNARFSTAVEQNINRIVGELEVAREPDRWLMERHPVDLTFAHDYAVARELTAYVERAFALHRGVPQVAVMRRQFGGHFFTSFMLPAGNGAATQFLGRSREEVERIERDTLRQEVAVYPRSLAGHPRLHGAHLVYDREWRALLIPAIDFPDQGWFDALVAHEMYHGWVLHRNPSAVKMAVMSDDWIREELEAHNLENQVLDDFTNGGYVWRLKEIVIRSKAKTLEGFLGDITADDLRALDRMFAPAGKDEGAVRTAQYLLSLSLTWIDFHTRLGKTRAKILVYRKFTNRR